MESFLELDRRARGLSLRQGDKDFGLLVCGYIASSLGDLLEGKRGAVTEQLVRYENILLATAREYLSGIKNPYELLRKIDSSSSSDTNLHLKRLSIIYGLLEIDPNDPIIDETRYINPDFQYPIR